MYGILCKPKKSHTLRAYALCPKGSAKAEKRVEVLGRIDMGGKAKN